MLISTLFLLSFAQAPAVVNPVSKDPGMADAGYLVQKYDIFRKDGHNISRTLVEESAFLVTTKHWIQIDDAKSGAAFSLLDLDHQSMEVPLRIIDIGGSHVVTGSGNEALGWFLFGPVDGNELRLNGNYQLIIHYDSIQSWNYGEGSNGVQIPTPSSRKTEFSEKVRLLLPNEVVKTDGSLGTVKGDWTEISGISEAEGFRGFLDNIDWELTPQTAEGSNELGVQYKLNHQVSPAIYGGLLPSNFNFNLAVEGRKSTDSKDPSLSEYSKSELNMRGMWLAGETRHYPIGFQLSGGYEGGDIGSESGGFVRGEVIATIPYVGDALVAWQDWMGYKRGFAPPYIGISYAKSSAEVGNEDQSRWAAEAGWVAPIALEWDLNLRWQAFEFDADAIGSEELLTVDLTYYPGGDLSQGMRMSFESGYRAAAGDIGSTVLLGYTVKF